ncbi:MAG: GFA family protein [Woeseiaceae bacterium]
MAKDRLKRRVTTHAGGCHCGKVRFDVDASANIAADECNCSICAKSGHLHLIVSADDFRLLQGADDISTYTFNTGIAKHYFCRHCGVKSFYVPRSHPHGISVNVNCLDRDNISSIEINPFDGKNWEENVANLSPVGD